MRSRGWRYAGSILLLAISILVYHLVKTWLWTTRGFPSDPDIVRRYIVYGLNYFTWTLVVLVASYPLAEIFPTSADLPQRLRWVAYVLLFIIVCWFNFFAWFAVLLVAWYLPQRLRWVPYLYLFINVFGFNYFTWTVAVLFALYRLAGIIRGSADLPRRLRWVAYVFLFMSVARPGLCYIADPLFRYTLYPETEPYVYVPGVNKPPADLKEAYLRIEVVDTTGARVPWVEFRIEEEWPYGGRQFYQDMVDKFYDVRPGMSWHQPGAGEIGALYGGFHRSFCTFSDSEGILWYRKSDLLWPFSSYVIDPWSMRDEIRHVYPIPSRIQLHSRPSFNPTFPTSGSICPNISYIEEPHWDWSWGEKRPLSSYFTPRQARKPPQ